MVDNSNVFFGNGSNMEIFCTDMANKMRSLMNCTINNDVKIDKLLTTVSKIVDEYKNIQKELSSLRSC